MLKSKRGPRGGYTLSREASEISVLDIINATQGPIVPVACLNEEKRNCKVFPVCVTWHVWKETQKLLVDYLDSVSIADLCVLAHERRLPREFDYKLTYQI